MVVWWCQVPENPREYFQALAKRLGKSLVVERWVEDEFGVGSWEYRMSVSAIPEKPG